MNENSKKVTDYPNISTVGGLQDGAVTYIAFGGQDYNATEAQIAGYVAASPAVAGPLANAVQKADLANPSTTPAYGFSAADVQSIMDNGVVLQSYAALLAYNKRGVGVRINTPGIDGVFRYNASLPNTGNGGTTFPHASGVGAWERLYVGAVYVDWWGAGLGAANESPFIQACINAIQASAPILLTAGKTYKLGTPLMCPYRVNLESSSVSSVIGTATLDGSGLASNEYCIYLQSPRSRVAGIEFLGNGRTVSGINTGVTPLGAVSHSSIIERCNFFQCRIAVDGNYTCNIRLRDCYFNSDYIGVRVDNTANTWNISGCLFFNFTADVSLTCIHAKWADQLTVEDNCWFELNSVPFIIGERITNFHMNDSWVEHLVVGNSQPLIVVNGSTIINPYNFVVENTALLTNYPTIATLANLQNFELRQIRTAGMVAPNVLPQINCDTVELVRMTGIYSEYVNNPPTQSNRILVSGAGRVIQEDVDFNLVAKPYTNQVWDSSFKTITNTAVSGDVTRAQDPTVGVHDSNSMQIAFGAAGTGRARTANAINLVGGQYVRLSAWLWTDSTTLFNQVILRIAGPTSGKNRVVPLTTTPRRVDLMWQVPATGFDGAYFAFFDYSVIGALRAYNVWVDDVQMVVDSAPIPYLPYAMNNSLATPMRIGVGLNLTEHTFMGARITTGTDAPTTGTAALGDTVINNSPTRAKPVTRRRCSAAGSPGTFLVEAWVVFSGTTAQRPTLTANETGVQYLDTTLAAAGKPITWTGTVWVDGTGATI